MFGLERFMPGRGARQVPETRTQVPPPFVSESSASEQGEQQGALDRARARVALAREFVSRIEQHPDTLYGARREDAMEDLLLGEVALDMLPRQSTTDTVVRDLYREERGGRMVLVEELTFPERLVIAGHTLEVGELLGRGGMGSVVEYGDYVVKFARVSDERADNKFLSFAARELSAMARFNPMDEADPVLLEALEASRLSPRPTRTTDRIPGFLGATRVEFPVEENGQVRTEEHIAIAMERVRGQDLHEAIEGEATFESVTPQTYPELLRQIAEALASFHEANILHRDVKPANIMATFPAPGKVDAKLTDMGLAVDADYRRRVQRDAVHKPLFAAASALRDHLLELSLNNQFSERAEEAWLELAALVDRVEDGEAMELVALHRRLGELVGSLPELVKPPVEEKTSPLHDPFAFLVQGTMRFMDFDTQEGTPKSTSDVYALGVTIGTFLAANAARRDGVRFNFEQAWARMGTSDVATDAILLKELGGDERARAMAGLLKSMINKDASQRPANAMEVLKRLEEIRD